MTIVLLAAALILAYANGANDNFKAVATIYGSSTLGYRASLILGTVAQVEAHLVSRNYDSLMKGVRIRGRGGR